MATAGEFLRSQSGSGMVCLMPWRPQLEILRRPPLSPDQADCPQKRELAHEMASTQSWHCTTKNSRPSCAVTTAPARTGAAHGEA